MVSKLTTDEEGVAGKDSLACAILHVVADAVLGVTRCVNCLYRDFANPEDFLVLRRLCHTLAVFAADDVEFDITESIELLFCRELNVGISGMLLQVLPVFCCHQHDPSGFTQD